MQATVSSAPNSESGIGVPLLYLYPGANIPTLQVSLPMDSDEPSAFKLGGTLRPLAQEGVLIIGSGSLTHNLYEFRMGASEEDAAAYAEEFSVWVRQAVLDRISSAMATPLCQADSTRGPRHQSPPR